MAKKEEKGVVSKLESVDISKLVSGLVDEYRKKNMLIETGHINCEFFDSGNLALNYILSGKFDEGFPTGQVINVHGDPQTGKSLLVCNAIANFLKKYPDGVAILDDTEFAYVEYLGSNLGIDESRFIRLNTSTVEEHSKAVFFGGKIKTMDVDTGKDVEVEVEPIVPKLWNKGCKHILIAVDSIAMWSTEHELAIVGLDKPDMGKAKVLRALLRTIMPEVKKYGLTYIITNHLIFNIGDMFGPRKIEGGGQAPAYQSSIRLCMQIAGKIKVDSKGKSGELGGDKDDKNAKIVGVVARATTVKNRFAPPFRNCLIDIKFDAGMSRFSGLLKLLQDLSIVLLAPGGWYETCDKKIKFQSKDFEAKWPEIKALITPDRVKMRESESPIIVEDIKDEE
jgi:recombination protein RecA